MATWIEQIEKTSKKYLKTFRDFYEGLVNDKINGSRVLGRIV